MRKLLLVLLLACATPLLGWAQASLTLEPASESMTFDTIDDFAKALCCTESKAFTRISWVYEGREEADFVFMLSFQQEGKVVARLTSVPVTLVPEDMFGLPFFPGNMYDGDETAFPSDMYGGEEDWTNQWTEMRAAMGPGTYTLVVEALVGGEKPVARTEAEVMLRTRPGRFPGCC